MKQAVERVSRKSTSALDSTDLHDKKVSLIGRLKKIEGQMRGIQQMIEREDSCENIARQLAAARAALDRSFYEMVACSIERELGALVSPHAHEALEQASRILAKYG